MTAALIYVRVSTDEQAQSAETQERAAVAWCAAQGHTVVEIVRDVGYSGAEWTRRPGLAQLQQGARRGPSWRLVVVRDVDRLGRDGVRLPVLLSDLRDAGVDVVEYSTGQMLSLDGVGQLVASVRACVAQIEREQIAHRVRVAHRQQHTEGRVVGGIVYGYRNVRSTSGVHYEPDPEQVEVVREIYARAAQGEGVRGIVRALNARAVPPPSAGRRGTGSWSPSAVHLILRSERYRGVLSWGATTKIYKGGTRGRIDAPDESLVRVELPTLAIVTAAEWEAAQSASEPSQRAADRPRVGTRARYLLVGHAVCDRCGGPLAVGRSRQGAETVPAYHCGWHHDRGDTVCPERWKRRIERLDDVVREWLLQDVLDAAFVADAVALARRQLADTRPDPRVETLRAEERETQQAVTRLVAAVEQADDVTELIGRLRERRARLAAIRAELASAVAPVALPVDLDASLAGAVAGLRSQMATDLTGAREVLGALLPQRLRVSHKADGEVWIEGRASLGGLLRGRSARGLSASPEGNGQTPRYEIGDVPIRRRAA